MLFYPNSYNLILAVNIGIMHGNEQVMTNTITPSIILIYIHSNYTMSVWTQLPNKL